MAAANTVVVTITPTKEPQNLLNSLVACRASARPVSLPVSGRVLRRFERDSGAVFDDEVAAVLPGRDRPIRGNSGVFPRRLTALKTVHETRLIYPTRQRD